MAQAATNFIIGIVKGKLYMNNESYCRECNCEFEGEGIVKTLRDNIGKVIRVFVESGGCAGEGFTGLVAAVHDGTLRLITTLPSPPPSPFTCRGCCCNEHSLCRRLPSTHFGSSVVIPICKITSVAVAEV